MHAILVSWEWRQGGKHKSTGGVGRKVHLIYFTQFWWECQWKIWAEFKRVVPSHYAKWRCSNESKCHLICPAINSYRIPEQQWWIFQFGFYMRALLEYIMKNKVENSSNLWCKNSCALCKTKKADTDEAAKYVRAQRPGETTIKESRRGRQNKF